MTLTVTPGCGAWLAEDPAVSVGTDQLPSQWAFLGLPNVVRVQAASHDSNTVDIRGNAEYVATDLIDSAGFAGWGECAGRGWRTRTP